MLDQNYKNVKKTIQVGLHGAQGGRYWVTWYSIESSLNKQVLNSVSNLRAGPHPLFLSFTLEYWRIYQVSESENNYLFSKMKLEN